MDVNWVWPSKKLIPGILIANKNVADRDHNDIANWKDNSEVPQSLLPP